MTKTAFHCAALLVLSSALPALADGSPESDKAQYNLFNPTPAAQMRAWHTDRAGASPYTCDAGHYEVNVYAVNYGHDSETYGRFGYTVEAWAFGTLGLKAGLLYDLDVEVSLVPYENIAQTYTAAGDGVIGYQSFQTNNSGFGDVNGRLNWNLWGNDGGATALALSGLIKFPTASDDLGNGHYEGGPALQFAAKIPCGFEMRVDCFANFYEGYSDQKSWYVENLISLSHPIVEKLEGYCVFDTVVFTTAEEWNAVITPGLNYRPVENVEVFVRVGFGVKGYTYDYSPTVGVAARF